MLTKLKKNSILIQQCQKDVPDHDCKKCDAKNEFDCVASLIYCYLMYCADSLDELNQKDIDNESKEN